MIITGVVISSECLRISFLLTRRNINITDLFFKTLERKGCDALLVRFKEKSYS